MPNIRFNSDTMIFWVKMIIHLQYLCETKTDWKWALKLKFQSNVFDDICYKVCIMTWNVLPVKDENCERCTFPILPVNVPRSNDKYTFVQTRISYINMIIHKVSTFTVYKSFLPEGESRILLAARVNNCFMYSLVAPSKMVWSFTSNILQWAVQYS